MSTITREQLRERAREKVKGLEFSVTQTAFADSRAELEEELELARIVLASLEAETDDFDAARLAFENWVNDNYDSRLMRSGTGYAGQVLNQMWQCWLACRAAMLQSFGNSEQLNSPVIPDCSCRTCRPVTMTDMRFVVCPECGNKRCPHANDHRNACTESNEPGQEGRAYPAAPQQEVKP